VLLVGGNLEFEFCATILLEHMIDLIYGERGCATAVPLSLPQAPPIRTTVKHTIFVHNVVENLRVVARPQFVFKVRSFCTFQFFAPFVVMAKA
jgi:hypothetical protein